MSGSNFPNAIDSDVELPPVNDNIVELGAEAINALRDAVFNIETNIGINANGSAISIADRLGISLEPDGTIKPSAITSLGLVVLPITDSQISNTAEITESKLKLDHRTQDLFNYIRDLAGGVNQALGWISTSGSKLEPHLAGTSYRHSLSQIDVSHITSQLLKNKFRTFRDNSSAYAVINDMNSELLAHQFADGSPFGIIQPVITNNGSEYTSNYAHTASGIFINTTRFDNIPQTTDDLQQLAQFIDNSSTFLLGTRIQNLYSNGISRASRSSSLITDGYGQPLVPSTPAIAYLLGVGTGSSPFDNIDTGDDIIEFKPAAADLSSNSFDEKFALVKIGDIVRINYGTIEVQFIIKEKKYIQSGGNKKFIIRINGKNLFYSPNASARIDRPLFNNNKPGVLSIAPANNNFSEIPSLIIGNPRGAQALGLNFNPDHLDATHYLLYLVLYPSGSPQDGYFALPAIDVTGNRGASPGKYTLESVIQSTNSAFRQTGYNYRFTAFSYQGEFGIMLSDPYSNTSFSIVSAIVSSDGSYDHSATTLKYPNNVIDVFTNGSLRAIDALGFGPFNSGLASPPFMNSYPSAEMAVNATKIFVPLRRNNYYVNGAERERLALDVGQALDEHGDGYWVATIHDKSIFPGPPPTGRVQVTYRVDLNLSTSNLKPGKTLVVQSIGQGTLVDLGRFIITNVTFSDCLPDVFTDITVYDAVHAADTSPQTTLDVGAQVAIYFSSDSVSFNRESATDFTGISPFKRHFEVYIDQDSKTFTHERARINISGSTMTINGTVPLYTYSELSKLDIIKVSPKLRGFQFGSVNKITLNILDYNDATGNYHGILSSYDGTNFTKPGPLTTGKKGQITRFYDETNIDYIDIIFDINVPVASFGGQVIDFQLFPTLSLDDEIMMIGTCQLNDSTNNISQIRDERQFGNISEKELSTSALNFISLPEKLLHSNGIVRGFDFENNSFPSSDQQIFLTGGLALVNGKLIQFSDETVIIPTLKEYDGVSFFNINWALCVNDKGEYQPIPLLDFDSFNGTPNNPNRTFRVFNPKNGSSYFIDAISFSDLINIRKDLTLIYLVFSSVDTISLSNNLTITDARKYVNDADSNLPLKLTAGDAQGNFRSVAAIFNWIRYNNRFNGIANISGAGTTAINDGIVNGNISFDFSNSVIIDGENNAFLTMKGAVTLGSNVTFKNLSINFTGGLSVVSGARNVVFENCNISILSGTNTFNFINGNNIIFNKCQLSIQFNTGSNNNVVFSLGSTTNFSFIDSSLDANFPTVPGSIPPGDIFVLLFSSNINILNSIFNGNFVRFMVINESNSVHINNSSITSTYNPGEGPDFSFSTTNLVNTGRGYIYSLITAAQNDIVIDNVIFNYSPVIPNSNRFSFINFELVSGVSLNNLNIINCRFNHTNTGGTIEDIRSAIAIVNIATAGTPPILLNAKIDHNICNRNQSIIVTSKADADIEGNMLIPGLSAQNCTISNNICGTIGYWISAAAKTVNISPNVNTFSDKDAGITIENNICHYISNLNHAGCYFMPSRVTSGASADFSHYPSGNVIISNNKCNWIHVGIAFEENSSIIIKDNSLCSYDVSYLDPYNDNPFFHGLNTNQVAIFVNSNKHVVGSAESPGVSNDSSCVISGNTTSTGYWILSSSVFKYLSGYIWTTTSSIITNNTLKGVGFGSGVRPISVGGVNNIITNNRIYKQGNPIDYYVGFADAMDFPVWGGDPNGNGNGSSGVVTGNFFDSPFINDSTLDESTVLFPKNSRWTVDRNINQTGTLTIPLTNAQLFNDGYLFNNGDYFISKAPSTSLNTINTVTASPFTKGYKSNVLWIHETATLADPVARNIGLQQNLEKLLPNNVRVIRIDMGVRSFDSVLQTVGFASYVDLFLNKYNISSNYTNLDYFTTYNADPDTKIVNDNTAPAAIITGGQMNATPLTNIATINLETPTNVTEDYITGKGYDLSISTEIMLKRTTGSDINVYISPILVKYRW